MAFTSRKGRQGVQKDTGYSIDNSLRFNDDDSAYLSRTPSSAGNRKTFTWSGWVKRGNLETGVYNHTLFSSDTGTGIFLGTTPTIPILQVNAAGGELQTNQYFRDTSAWYHIVFSVDTTNATADDRLKLYINGVEVTSLANRVNPALNAEGSTNNTTLHQIGKQGTLARYLDGYLAEVNFVDGQALTPADFGETDATYGHWKAKKYTGTYGTNGFYLDFKNSGSLGNDANGSNNWTPNNLAATDQMLDSPTNNFCTLNPLNSAGGVISEGNLKITTSGTNYSTWATFAVASGKWYWEEVILENTTSPVLAIAAADDAGDMSSSVDGRMGYQASGLIFGTGSGNITGLTTAGVGDIMSIALDMDNDTVQWYVNGSSVNAAISTLAALQTGLGASPHHRANDFDSTYNFGQDSSFAGNKTAQGNADGNGYGDFYYAPPTGFLALCTQNLPEPTVVPSEHFNTVTYSSSTSPLSITGVGFQPDLVWAKSRSTADWHALVDVTRGTSNTVFSNDTNAELNISSVTSFDTDGFTVGSNATVNEQVSTQTYVAWNWKANGTGVSNTNGTITSTVSANADAGFSIVSYTGTGSAATVGHGLSKAPELIIAKNRGHSADWAVGGNVIGSWSDKTLELNNTVATVTDSNIFGADPTTSLFTIGTSWKTNRSGYNHIAYCFHSVDGYSKVGSYTGNGSTDGTFVYTGFRPAYVMWKKTNASGTMWQIFDNARNTFNVMDKYLQTNSSNAEANYDFVDYTSNGFKHRHTSGHANGNNETYIFLAFAENPFKYTNAR